MDAGGLQRLLAGAFARTDPEIEVRVESSVERPGRFLATIRSANAEVEWLSSGWPGQVRDLLKNPNLPNLVVASELSPGARTLLTEHGLSWADETGAARVSLPGLYIRVDMGQAPKKPRRKHGWTPATLAVCEALLTGIGGTVAEVTAATTLAPSTVAGALRHLQAAHLLQSDAARGRNSRRAVADQDQLLREYATAAGRMRSPESIRVGVLWRNPVRGVAHLGSRLSANGIAWSITGALAADTLAPYLTEVDPWEVYVDGGSPAALGQIAREVGLQEEGGGRLLLRPFPTSAKDALSTEVAGQRLAAWPRVFSDLRMIGVRGEEAAEHLREQISAAT